jgi:hypothetical protein
MIAQVTYSSGLSVVPVAQTFNISALMAPTPFVSDTPVMEGPVYCSFSGSGIDSLTLGAGTISGGCGSSAPWYHDIFDCASLSYQRIGLNMVVVGSCTFRGIPETLAANVALGPSPGLTSTTWSATITFAVA